MSQFWGVGETPEPELANYEFTREKKKPVCEGTFVAKFGGVGCVSNFYYTLRDLHIVPWVNLSPFTRVFEPLFTVTVIFCFFTLFSTIILSNWILRFFTVFWIIYV